MQARLGSAIADRYFTFAEKTSARSGETQEPDPHLRYMTHSRGPRYVTAGGTAPTIAHHTREITYL